MPLLGEYMTGPFIIDALLIIDFFGSGAAVINLVILVGILAREKRRRRAAL